jgi:hypothetical protein
VIATPLTVKGHYEMFKRIFLVFLTLAQPVQSQIFLEKLPKDVSSLSSSEQATILNQIAVFSYQVLLDVPEQGLSAKRQAIEEVISARRWLEAQKQPLFLLLALQIQEVVDFSVFNEIWRENRARWGLVEVYPPFKKGSFDKPLLAALLQLNELAEKPLIEYALSLEGSITNALRQLNYPVSDYLNGAAFEMMPFYLVQDIIDSWVPLGPFNKLSKSNPGKALFLKTLASIDATENIRVAVRVYFNHGGFPKTETELRKLIREELKRLPRMLVSEGNPAMAGAIIDTIGDHVEPKPNSYRFVLATIFYPFLREENNELLPKPLLELAKRELAKGVIPFKPGQWLTFKE